MESSKNPNKQVCIENVKALMFMVLVVELEMKLLFFSNSNINSKNYLAQQLVTLPFKVNKINIFSIWTHLWNQILLWTKEKFNNAFDSVIADKKYYAVWILQKKLDKDWREDILYWNHGVCTILRSWSEVKITSKYEN